VHLVLKGIPPHVWDQSTVEHLLGMSCALEDLASETASRADLGLFKATAWARDVDSIPTERLLWVPEPLEGWELVGPQPLRRIKDLGMLEYRVLIHVLRVEEFVPAEGPSWSRRSPGSDQRGFPNQDSPEEGFWTSRSTSWSLGRPDRRGGGGGGGGGGTQRAAGVRVRCVSRAGQGGHPLPSDWRLPRINGPVHVPVATRLSTAVPPGDQGPLRLVSRQDQLGEATTFPMNGVPAVSVVVPPSRQWLAKGKESERYWRPRA
jgi:hypothetical protein